MLCPHCEKEIPESEMTTYMIVHTNKKRTRISVPSAWKVTFGPAARGDHAGDTGRGIKMPLALRFYENDKQQRAIFTDVLSFRDTSIKIEEERIDIQEKEGFAECDGRRKAVAFVAKSAEWINPDDPGRPSLPTLPSDKEAFDWSELREQQPTEETDPDRII